MEFPVDYEKLNEFVIANGLLDLTRELLRKCLISLYEDDHLAFEEWFSADAETVIKQYSFITEGFSFSRSLSHDPPLNYISVWIRIYDLDGDYLGEYTAFFDSNLNCIDDNLK